MFAVADVSYNRKLLELMQDQMLRFVGIGLAVVVVRYNHKLLALVLSLMKHFVQVKVMVEVGAVVVDFVMN